LKKRTKKLLLCRGGGDGGAKTRIKQNFFGSFFQKRTSFLLALLLATPAHAQNAATGCGVIAPPGAPGEGPGGNVFSSHIGQAQPQDAPNDEVATYPDITQIQPDLAAPDQAKPDAPPLQPFPFSGTINDPVLSQGNAPEQPYNPPKTGC
jgi:hypothetical protein